MAGREGPRPIPITPGARDIDSAEKNRTEQQASSGSYQVFERSQQDHLFNPKGQSFYKGREYNLDKSPS